MKKLKLKLKKKGPVASDFGSYWPNHKHTPVIFFGPKDFSDWKFFHRKANKILKQFTFIQGIVTLDQRTFTNKIHTVKGVSYSSLGIGSFGELYSIRMPFQIRQMPPFRTRCTIFSEREIKKPVKRNKAMFAKAREVAKVPPFALIFNDGSKEVKQFIRMCRKRDIKRMIITLKD